MTSSTRPPASRPASPTCASGSRRRSSGSACGWTPPNAAYNELSGHQSSSLALLDAHRSGVVLSAIVHRDQARLYVKQVTHGEGEIELSPEEREAIEAALAPTQPQAVPRESVG